MIKLSAIESKTLQVIKQWQDEYRNSPLISDLAAELNRSYTPQLRTLHQLSSKGYIDLIRKNWRYVIVPLYWE